MWNAESLRWIVVGAIGLAFILVFVLRLSPNARLRRRLKKTHSRLTSKSRRPSVQLNVKPPKEK
jgi:hypothetical protein